MGIEFETVLLFGVFLVLMVAGLPLVFALGAAAVIGTYFLWGPSALHLAAIRAFAAANSFVLLAIPLFIFMGCMLERSGIARGLYELMHKWLGGVRGGLAVGTVIVCAIFAAMVGVSGAATVTMAVVALPSMLNYGYSKHLTVGTIAAGGALGVLIPPSVLFIVLGLYTNTSVGKLFLGGLPAGLILVTLFVLYSLIACHLRPAMGPALPPEERASWGEKIRSLKAVGFPLLLITLVLGSLLIGLATPSEAAGIGALGAMLCAAANRSLDWKAVSDAAQTTLRLSAMVMWIVFAANLFTALYTAIGAEDLVRDALSIMPGGRWGVVIGMQMVWFLMGCFLDPLGIMIITAPLFFPIIVSLGFDPIWFGVLFVVNMEMAFLTPPFGFNLFYMRSCVPPSISMGDIYRAVIPFILLQAVGLAIMMVFPELITWLPNALL
ncbi:TRAP transporter large permease [Siccirubricoccus phaeus]|uniref:TRAP transporter large permease n=1 Tax=Siccirubricoccus phaeus TaxID=2595053 RepID=UPI0011F3C1C8|nr:TRAP transporter large permease subunit [Siccirubricoccus phaeus]